MMCFPFYASFLIERYSAEVVDMEEKHHLLISRQTKDEKWLMPHIRPGCRVDYGVGRVLFAGEIAGFLNPMGEGISAGMESGYCATYAIMEHLDNPSRLVKGMPGRKTRCAGADGGIYSLSDCCRAYHPFHHGEKVL